MIAKLEEQNKKLKLLKTEEVKPICDLPQLPGVWQEAMNSDENVITAGMCIGPALEVFESDILGAIAERSVILVPVKYVNHGSLNGRMRAKA